MRDLDDRDQSDHSGFGASHDYICSRINGADIPACAGIEHLAQRRGEIVRVGGGTSHDQDAVAVVLVRGATVRGQAMEGKGWM